MLESHFAQRSRDNVFCRAVDWKDEIRRGRSKNRSFYLVFQFVARGWLVVHDAKIMTSGQRQQSSMFPDSSIDISGHSIFLFGGAR
jgi:hypothetical protein